MKPFKHLIYDPLLSLLLVGGKVVRTLWGMHWALFQVLRPIVFFVGLLMSREDYNTKHTTECIIVRANGFLAK